MLNDTSYFLRKHILLPLCLGAALLSACATPGTTGGSTSTSTTAPAPRPSPRIDWRGLRQSLDGALGDIAGAEVDAPTDNSLHLRIPVSNGFGSDSADLRAPLAHALDTLIPTLNGFPDVAIHIVGHTDSVGSEMYNLQLSIRRGEAVMEYLRTRGIALDRMSADGKGEAESIADNSREAGRARNRRVEFFLRPLE
ncbi:MAG: OmpA family protein [Azoarcus sp.]|jgi:outer membrane protein OmpA-like peptidoglycan-associated protein|nr:OmpA family protein [Azoarcus sp.]MDD2874509.1 OmpA family protein [Azoarcus sp.]MDX9837229.1 OmpA family protein [Azoarcus sp.]